jgi:RNA polymerase sigma-70 factor (ECF subfamily)
MPMRTGGPDRAAEIERIYRTRYGVFLRVAVAIVRDERLAEEAVQDGFVRALRHRGGFSGEGSLEAWIWRIVVNEARRRGRAEPRSEPLPPLDTLPARNGDEPDTEVAALVAALPERQRLALFLRYYADLDYEAIAVALGVRPGTVAASLHQAHQALRRELTEVRP